MYRYHSNHEYPNATVVTRMQPWLPDCNRGYRNATVITGRQPWLPEGNRGYYVSELIAKTPVNNEFKSYLIKNKFAIENIL